ncbi:NAD(P)-dependent oxidoreductase [Paracoccus tibetensis]|uniref:Phosphoglycerate dehydrogenase n=1 Tax=Paracoccus tibetensis TaxID=336292 RepID=A0A1G5FV05_9RHOB|nr:NAD(P)-dependent oxidoreductase [Paracoccus tibetensis]SCY43059.1 Phosphoglycerate dehydrogenase [Paracoccus tibetensis]
MTEDDGKLLILHQHPPEAVASLEAVAGGQARLRAVPPASPFGGPDADALLTFPAAMRGIGPDTPRPTGWPWQLRWVHFGSTGIDRMPRWLLEPELVTVSRGAQADAIAEYVVMMALAFEKRLPQILAHSPAAWAQPPLGGLSGRTVGLLGFGEIGRAVAARLVPFGVRLIAHRRHGARTGCPKVSAVTFDELLAESDHLVICTPLTDETRGMIDKSALAAMHRGAHLINVARGAIIDTDALREALDEDRLAMASLDVAVPEPPPEDHWLYTHPRVRLTGHVSHSGPLTRQRGQDILARNLRAFLQGRAEDMHGVVSREAGY